MSIDVEKFMMNVKINLLRQHCFYGYVLAQLPIVYDDHSVPRLGVGKNNVNEQLVKMYVNQDYVEHIIDLCNHDEKRVVAHFTEVLRHEVHHLIFEHLTLNLPDKHRQSTACELSVNSYIDRNKLATEQGTKAGGCFPEDYDLPPKLGAQEYYALLENNKVYKLRRKKYLKRNHFPNNGNGNTPPVKKKTQEQKDTDDLAERQEKASVDTASGNYGNDVQMEQQDRLSKETEQLKSTLGAISAVKATQGLKVLGVDEAIELLEEARTLQDEAMTDLNNGAMDSASLKQHEAAVKIADAADKLQDKDDDGGAGGGDGDNDGDGSGDGDDDGDDMLDSHEKWSSVSGDDMTNEMIKDIIRMANETCKQTNRWGDIPGEIRDAIAMAYSIEREVIPWEIVLKNFLASSSENVLSYTMKRKSKRYGTRPGTKKDDVLKVAIGIDTSGSIDNEMLSLFFKELYWIDKTGTKMTVFEWDTQVNREYDYSEFDGTVTGRGGTDPTDFLEKVSERKFDCVITFTDLYFSDIEKRYNMPMLWICDRGRYSEDDSYPVKEGIIMRVNEERNGFEVVRY